MFVKTLSVKPTNCCQLSTFLPVQPGEVCQVRVVSLAGPGVKVVLPVVPQVLTVEAVLAVLLSAGRTAVDRGPAVPALLPSTAQVGGTGTAQAGEHQQVSLALGQASPGTQSDTARHQC